MEPHPRTVILVNGELPDPDYAKRLLHPTDRILVADGGSRHAQALGVVPSLLVGDSDSIPAEIQAWLDSHMVPQQRFPAAKEASDLELAIQIADEMGSASILLLGLAGSRIDHTLVNFALLAQAPARRTPMAALVGRQYVQGIWRSGRVEGAIGDLVSLLPWGGAAHGVHTSGLRWNLHGESMAFAASRGISNQLVARTAEIRLYEGMLLVIHTPQEG